MSDEPPTSVLLEEVSTAASAAALAETVAELQAGLQPSVDGTHEAQSQPDLVAETAHEEDEQPAISLHEQSSPRPLSPTDQHTTSSQSCSRPSTSSVPRPVSAFSLPIDPRFPSDPSPQLLAILQAADEADRLEADSHSPMLTERSSAAGKRERPESATPLGGLDTLQGLPSQSADYAFTVMQSKMRWRESTRIERSARVERRRDELLAEFEAEVRGSFNVSAAVKQPMLAHAHNQAVNAKQPLSTGIAAM